MPFLEEMLRILAPAGIGAGTQALANIGVPRRRRRSPLAAGARGAGAGILDLLERSRLSGQEEEQDEALAEILGVPVEMVREFKKAGLGAGDIQKEAEEEKGFREEALTGQAMQQAEIEQAGIEGPPAPMPTPEGADFWETFAGGFPELTGADVSGLDMDQIAEQRARLSPNQDVRFHRAALARGPVGQAARMHKGLSGRYPGRPPEDINRMMTEFMQLTPAQQKTAGMQMAVGPAEEQRKAAAKITEEQRKAAIKAKAEEAKHQRTVQLKTEVYGHIWSPEAIEFSAQGIPIKQLEDYGHIPEMNPGEIKDYHTRESDLIKLEYTPDNMALRESFREKAEDLVGPGPEPPSAETIFQADYVKPEDWERQVETKITQLIKSEKNELLTRLLKSMPMDMSGSLDALGADLEGQIEIKEDILNVILREVEASRKERQRHHR